MKKCLIFLLITCLLLTACASSTDEETSVETLTIDTSVADFDMNNTDQPDAVTIEADQVVYDANDLIITTDSFESDYMETYLILTFENTSDEAMFLVCESAAINTFMISSSFSLELPAGESVLTGISFENSEINACEITTITDIEFSLTAYDDAYDILYETDFIHIQTSQSGASEQSVNTEGVSIYDKDDIQIISKGFTTDEEWGDVVVLLIINQSDRNIYFGLDESTATVNDDEYEISFGCMIPAEHNAIQYMYFSDADGNSVTEVSSATVIFTLTDTDTWDIIDTTATVTLTQ